MTVALHTCCGPCSSSCVPRLKELGYEVVMFFANSNIATHAEFLRRLAEAQKLLGNLSDFPVQDRARLADWYAKNQARIVFDKKSGKFTLKK